MSKLIIIFVPFYFLIAQDSINYISKELIVIDSLNRNIIKIIKVKNSSISELLNKESGIYIRDYGGIGGMKTISARGSNSAQTQILYNGFRLNSAQNGMFDLSQIDANMLSEIELNKSGNCALNGTNSISGSLNFKSQVKSGFITGASLGSFDTYRSFLNYGDYFGKHGVQLYISYLNSNGDYPYNFAGEEFTRNNSGSNDLNANFHYNFVDDDHLYQLETGINLSNRGNPGPVVFNNSSDNGTTIRNNVYLLSKMISNNFEIGFFYRHNDLNFSQFNSNEIFGNNTFNYFSNNYQTFIKYDFEVNSYKFKIKYDLDVNSLFGQMADPNADSFYQRFNNGFSFGISKEISNNFFSNINFRYDHFNDNDDFLSSSLDLTYFKNGLKLTSIVSNNFRIPSFNELYYLNFGNTDLIPERSINGEINISYKYDFLEISINPFYYLVSDKIVAVPQSPILWSAQNIDKTENYGFEIESTISFKDVQIDINYSLQNNIDLNTKTQIAYTPQETIFGSLNYIYRSIKFDFTAEYCSFRYYLNDNDSAVLDNYLLANFDIAYDIKEIKTEFILRLNNLLNKEYEIIRSYPMPGFNLAFEGKITI